MKKQVFKVGDRVKIINPEIILRVGYPLDKKAVKTTVFKADQKNEIRNLINKFGFYSSAFPGSDRAKLFDFSYFDDIFDQIEDVLAYFTLRKLGFGGRERTLHTVIYPELKDQIGFISDKNVVKTGTYEYGRAYSEIDYDPPYLSNVKSHVILYLGNIIIPEKYLSYNCALAIEDKNVERVENKTNKMFLL